MTLGTLQNIPPDPTPNFVFDNNLCAPAQVTISNNSTFGCANSLDPNYNPSGQPYSIIQPSFNYNFGNCEDSLYTPFQSEYQNNIYSDLSTTYNTAGLYPIEIGVSNACTTVFFNDTVNVYPQTFSRFSSIKSYIMRRRHSILF